MWANAMQSFQEYKRNYCFCFKPHWMEKQQQKKKIVTVLMGFFVLQDAAGNMKIKTNILISYCLEKLWVGIAASFPQQLMPILF